MGYKTTNHVQFNRTISKILICNIWLEDFTAVSLLDCDTMYHYVYIYIGETCRLHIHYQIQKVLLRPSHMGRVKDCPKAQMVSSRLLTATAGVSTSRFMCEL
jgi:hypothetical protein